MTAEMLNTKNISLEDPIYNILTDHQKNIWTNFLQKCIISCEEDNNFGYQQEFYKSPNHDLDILDVDNHSLIYYVFLVLNTDQEILDILHIIFNLLKIKIKDHERNILVNPILYLLNNPDINPDLDKINNIMKILIILLENGADPNMIIYNHNTCFTLSRELDQKYNTDFELFINNYWNFDSMKTPE